VSCRRPWAGPAHYPRAIRYPANRCRRAPCWSHRRITISSSTAAIKARSGLTVVQDPGDAQYPNMPVSALAHVDVDHVIEAAKLGSLIGEVCTEDFADVDAELESPEAAW
jgi:hypothetical protein